MKNSAYLAVDVEECLRRGHHFKLFGSDKNPLKRNLACRECSVRTGKTACAAYGDDGNYKDGQPKSWGLWRETQREPDKFNEDDKGEMT